MDFCGAPLRKKPGQTCRARPLKGQRRCRLHAGRPKGSGSPEGREAARAGLAAYYAKYRAAKARGEPVRLPGGRRKRWLVPRWWRLKLSDAEQAAVLAHMAAYDARVRGGEPRPPWQASTSTTMVAKDLESCERALIFAMNRVDPPPLETIEQVYANVREAEALVGDAGSEFRLRRLEWEIERFRRHRLELSSALIEKAKAPEEAGAPSSSTREQPLALHPAPPQPEPPPDTFRDAVAPREAVERELAAELAQLESLIQTLPLSESARASLDTELRYAREMEERAQVLRRWLASTHRAYAMTEAIVAGRDQAAYEPTMRPRQQERPHSIAPWLRRL
jgi:hypothetical protein